MVPIASANSPMSDNKSQAARAKQVRTRRSRRALKTWAKRIVLILFSLAIVAAVALAMMPRPVPVDLAIAARGPMIVAVTEDGKTRVKNRYVVAAPLSGDMPRLALWEGDVVAAGDVLTGIVPPIAPLLDARSRGQAQASLAAAVAGQRQAAAQVARAQVALAEAVATARRQRELESDGVASAEERERADFAERARREDLVAAEFGARVAEQQAASARAALGMLNNTNRKSEQLEITAPVGGQVLRVLRRDAGPIAAGAPIIELGDPASLEIEVDVLTRDAVQIHSGSPVQIVRWGGAEALHGHVHRIEPSAFTRVSALGVEEQRVNVIIDFDDPHDRWQQLGDGFRVEAQIIVWSAKDVLSVPASAVFRHGDKWSAFVDRGGTAVLTEIEVGHRNDTHVEVSAGLNAGDRVVLYPSDRVDNGIDIQPR